ncbi:MAG: hypothetical protein LBD48_12575 [Treponema sp.]|jgi:hypothetical protein|nr:hypothetical protein [Treponema sp.]
MVQIDKNGKVLKRLVWVFIGLMIISCGTFQSAYTDDNISAELLVEDNDYVVLTIVNNSHLPIHLLTSEAYFSNRARGGENTVLIPFSEHMNPGAKVTPLPIPAGRTVSQRFVAPGYIKYKRGEVDNVDNWTPRSANAIKTVAFDFEYEIDGVKQHFVFEGSDFQKK